MATLMEKAQKELTILGQVLNTLANVVERREEAQTKEKMAYRTKLAYVVALNKVQSDCVYLDIGGIKFHTSREILTSPSASENVLPVLFNDNPNASEESEDGYTFFDNDPIWFADVLAYLRQGREVPIFEGFAPPRVSPCTPNSRGSRTSLGSRASLNSSVSCKSENMEYRGLDSLFLRAQKRSVVMVADTNDPFFNIIPAPLQVYNALSARINGKWDTKLPPTLERRFGSSGTVLNGKLVVTGGFDGIEYLNSVEEFDCTTKQWQMLPPMLTKRVEHASTVMNGKLYVVGGMNANGLCRMVEQYDPAEGRWCPLPCMASGRSQCAVCIFEDKLMVLGGENDSNIPLGLAEEYSPETDQQCRRLPSMLSKRAGCAVGVVDGQVVVSGGYDDLGNELISVEAFARDKWKWRPLPKDPLVYPAADFSLEARVLLSGEADAEDMVLAESLEVSLCGSEGPQATRSYSTFEMQTVPAQRYEGKKKRPQASPVKKHPPVQTATSTVRNRILITK